jgi:hypothetical protein
MIAEADTILAAHDIVATLAGGWRASCTRQEKYEVRSTEQFRRGT